MNTVDFLKQFESKNTSLIVNFFNELMILYNLFGDKHDIYVHNDDASLAVFRIVLDNPSDADRMCNELDCTEFSVYDLTYTISTQLQENKDVIVTVIRKV